jgi:MoaA/NifB/PqqE/SkfB family radical SAM enzyme
MLEMLELLPQLPQYMAFRRLGKPRRLPLNLVVSLSYRCNSRCKTCNVWQKSADELTADEWRQTFAKIGTVPYYLTFSGGEPFLRNDIVEIVSAACELCKPRIITIPTNALMSRAIPQRVERILHAAQDVEVGVNVSLDGVGQEHDRIRGVEGNYEKALQTYDSLRALEYPNFSLSIHTVVSRFNAQRLPEIYRELSRLQPDSYISEIAEQRVELGTMGMDIAPSPQEYASIADFLINQIKNGSFSGTARITQAFRMRYYDLAKRILFEERQVIPCYAGFASGHIAPDGDVWTCCTRAEPVGNLRETGYDLRPIWFGERADALRRSIAAGECYCPMANVAYSNMLLHPPTLLRVARQVLFR